MGTQKEDCYHLCGWESGRWLTDESLFSSGDDGADSFRQAVRHVALNPDFAGAVVRINSPGGTVSASDAMGGFFGKLEKEACRRQPRYSRLRRYYTAVGGSKILANSTTITGSIGFAGKANYQVFFRI